MSADTPNSQQIEDLEPVDWCDDHNGELPCQLCVEAAQDALIAAAGFRFCGLNGDWSVRAWHVAGDPDGAWYVLTDDETDIGHDAFVPGFSVVCREGDDIAEEHSGTLQECLSYCRARWGEEE